MRRAFSDPSHSAISDLVSFDGRVAVVTGAGRGIGRAICRRLAEAGARVLACDVHQSALLGLAAELDVDTIVADATKADAMAGIATRAKELSGDLTIWVNNVGAYPGT